MQLRTSWVSFSLPEITRHRAMPSEPQTYPEDEYIQEIYDKYPDVCGNIQIT